MTNAEKKARFIQMRAEGESYSTIAAALGISRTTCSRWTKELESSIRPAEEKTLAELYKQYNGTRAARIKAYGETLKRIDAALSMADLSDIPPERLLEYQIRYIKALQGENVNTGEQRKELNPADITADNILAALEETRQALQRGDISVEQAKEEHAILAAELKGVLSAKAIAGGGDIPIVLTGDDMILD